MQVTQKELSMVHGIAHHLVPGGMGNRNYDDVVGHGMMGLAEARLAWRPDGGASFKTLAAIYARGRMVDQLRRQNRWYGREPGLGSGLDQDAAMPPREVEWLRGHDLPTPEADAESKEQRERLGQAIAALPEEERRTILLLYQAELSSREAGRRLNRSKRSINELRRKALARLRNALV